MIALNKIKLLFRSSNAYDASSYYGQLIDKYSYNLTGYFTLSNFINANQNKLNTNTEILIDSAINFNSTILDIKKKTWKTC
jgi:hypothetical protein